jgi:hypothetical protein
MNDIFREWFDDFVVVYIDDILVYNNYMEEHVEHLRKVSQRLRENKLYAKFEKCEFGVTELDFLGHRITQEGLKMDDHKVKAILDWEPPKLVPALRSFLGLTSYYSKFIKNFAKIVTSLINLLKKSSGTYKWEEACNEAFETLKDISVKAPVLKLPNFDKDFEIHSNAFDFAIGGVLMQDGRPVAFESKKLSETEQRWSTHEKEMWAVIHCFKTWGHYIDSKDVMVWTCLKSSEDFTCLTCQQNRTFNKKQARMLRPLLIPKGPWESVSMDFMVSVPPSRGFDAIMVVVDQFSKMAHFIPTKESATAQ